MVETSRRDSNARLRKTRPSFFSMGEREEFVMAEDNS